RQGRKLRRGSWGNRRPCAGHARRAAPYVSFVAISRSRRPANPCGVKIAWLENQTGVNYLTIRRHYGKWMPTEGESELSGSGHRSDAVRRRAAPENCSSEAIREEQFGQRRGKSKLSKCERGGLNPHGCLAHRILKACRWPTAAATPASSRRFSRARTALEHPRGCDLSTTSTTASEFLAPRRRYLPHLGMMGETVCRGRGGTPLAPRQGTSGVRGRCDIQLPKLYVAGSTRSPAL